MNECEIWHDRGNCEDCLYPRCHFENIKFKKMHDEKLVKSGFKDTQRILKQIKQEASDGW